MWPCRADFADAFVQSFSFTCAGNHSAPNYKQQSDLEACVLAVDAFFASYLVGTLSITLAFESGIIAYRNTFNVGHSLLDSPLHSSQLECSSKGTMNHVPLAMHISMPRMAGSNLHARLDLVGVSKGVFGAKHVQGSVYTLLNERCSVESKCELHHVPSALGREGCSLELELNNTH